MKKWLTALPQILILFVFAWLGKAAAAFFQLHIPGSLIGLGLLFAALQSGLVRLKWVEAGAALLLSEMILFFIPSIAGIVQYPWMLGVKGLLVLAVVVSGTALVMISTGVLAQRLFRWSGVSEQRDSVENL
ncbi:MULTISPECIES: CidA/LrgA family protein [Brevibacillus]|jgi:holin-like protein|uniref:Holin-like protein CidA n=1 Tax=Brevibacillus borstelensis AK1 TaxID=1300222 RepID=M8DXF7_9BACL|nr:CidA/LrgA family protein [Brevibacillus borstelensis]EMT51681.1 holin-like protein CidA [Brevibacillus borstelensis AK1]MCM3592965.1 CidA/LrgA family protein [Brevibacillus borstelensis]MCM3622135.1 CidA/LrgA family protein [Brevibacillus borstelensis]MED1745485.1 CidA/LrgA family protein [Brevibacillus borstelensis]MED1885320.1 CidA/LrgA family protein [Brevibacillus borstelensis]